MPVNNGEPKTWENIRLKSEKQQFQTMAPTCKEHQNVFCAEIWPYPHELEKFACKNQQVVGQVETLKGSEVCHSEFNNACRIFGADWSIKIRNNQIMLIATVVPTANLENLQIYQLSPCLDFSVSRPKRPWCPQPKLKNCQLIKFHRF